MEEFCELLAAYTLFVLAMLATPGLFGGLR